MIVFHNEMCVLFYMEPVDHMRPPWTSPGLLDCPGMFLGHCELVRYCVWSLGDVLAPTRGYCRRLIHLERRESKKSEADRITQGTVPE